MATTQSPLNAQPRKLILASKSPRRHELLREAGYVFESVPADLHEDDHPPVLPPIELATYLAKGKAELIAAKFPDDIILAADTVVAFGDFPIGTPIDEDHAKQMITLLAGTTHIVVTSVAIVRKADAYMRVERSLSAVTMRPMSDREIADYLATGRWQGKAGGYGAQHNDPFITRIRGDKTNVVGLPMKLTRAMLSAAGIEPQSI